MAEGPLATQCCIAGGGPAGMMLGLLLARSGVDVLVLEKHADFLRDFRGDTVHPSTLQVLHELGLLDAFLARPHQRVPTIGAEIGGEFLPIADFTRLPTAGRFIALMPQWDFLDFLAGHAGRYRGFRLMMHAEVIGLIEADGQVRGVRANTPDGPIEVRAGLVVGADGRHSTVRARAGLDVLDIGAPIDVLWMRLSRRPGDAAQTLGRIAAGRILVMLDRGDYWQCAYVIEKGGFDAVRRQGIDALRDAIAGVAPELRDRLGELRDFDDAKLLTVTIDRLRRWHRPGLLCIGDAAHAMSPVGGVGINLAIQDAVATANILAAALRQGTPEERLLRRVQRRRTFPTRATQRLQVVVQNRVIRRVLAGERRARLPLAVRLLRRWPALRRVPARLIGMGFRPEHVRTPEITPPP
ncbi:MAG: FAD-dependent oxidoreductase [Acidisphaera sp.]|nr:FAD-dependent oxidoreductase [Acidisphaera sp.]